MQLLIKTIEADRWLVCKTEIDAIYLFYVKLT